MEHPPLLSAYHCPLCGEMRALADTCIPSRSFLAYCKACWGTLPDTSDVVIWNTKRRDWACAVCIQAGRAIVAKYHLQQSVDAFPPALAVYRDQERNCKACGKTYTFSAEEQRMWYEEWCIPLEAEPKACLVCRKARRQSREVSLALQALKLRAKTEQSLEAMQALASFYRTHGKPTKADYWTRMARKTNAGN
jgi:hypothetical protein